MRAEHMQECHPLSIWNYLITLGYRNKNNNNKDSQLGSVSSRYLQIFSSVSAEGITPSCSQNRAITFHLLMPLSCFLVTGLVVVSHKLFSFSLWMLKSPQKVEKAIGDLSQNLVEFENCLNWFVWALWLHRYSKFTSQSYPHSQVALNNKHNLPFYLWWKWRSQARLFVKNVLYARGIRTLVV